jgi:hypothetical protein
MSSVQLHDTAATPAYFPSRFCPWVSFFSLTLLQCDSSTPIMHNNASERLVLQSITSDRHSGNSDTSSRYHKRAHGLGLRLTSKLRLSPFTPSQDGGIVPSSRTELPSRRKTPHTQFQLPSMAVGNIIQVPSLRNLSALPPTPLRGSSPKRTPSSSCPSPPSPSRFLPGYHQR